MRFKKKKKKQERKKKRVANVILIQDLQLMHQKSYFYNL